MNGYVWAGVLWYVVLTAVAIGIAARYDQWIAASHREDADVEQATRRVVPTSFLVVAGVAGTELFRLVRLAPLASVAAEALGYPWWLGAQIACGGFLLDAMSAYLATGWPMIRGDLLREAQAAEEAAGVGDAAIQRLDEMARELMDGDDA